MSGRIGEIIQRQTAAVGSDGICTMNISGEIMNEKMERPVATTIDRYVREFSGNKNGPDS
jgi:hypothetical protein